MEYEDFKRLLVQAGLGRIEQEIPKLVLPGMGASSRAVADEAVVGESRLGGDPDMPQRTEWPTRDGKSLEFVLQIRLKDLGGFAPSSLLPECGYLWFFYDFDSEPWGNAPEDRGGWAVIYEEVEEADLVRVRRNAERQDSGKLVFEQILTVPRSFSERGIPLELTEKEEEDWQEFIRSLPADCELAIRAVQMFGWPWPKQNDEMEMQCAAVAKGVELSEIAFQQSELDAVHDMALKQEWELLLQVNSHDAGPGWRWGGRGTLYFWIKKADLLDRKFDEVWMILQCS